MFSSGCLKSVLELLIITCLCRMSHIYFGKHGPGRDWGIKLLYSTSTRPGEGAIYRYLSRQGKIAGDIHETKSSGLSLS